MRTVSVFTVYNVVFCLLHVVWLQVSSSRISGVSYEAYTDGFSEELLRQEDPKARDRSHIGKRLRKMKRSLYERKFEQHLFGPEGKESKTFSYDHKISPKQYCGRLTAFRQEFLARPRKTGGRSRKEETDRQFIRFRSLQEKDEFNSYAVIEPSNENPSGSKWTVTTLSSVLLLIIILALCLHAPCPFLWKRQRSKLDVLRCPNPTVHNRPCGKCIFHSNTNTGSRRFSSQFTWTQETHPPAKLNRTKKKVTALFKETQPSEYRYTPLRNTTRREQQMTYEPEWTSIGAFLNYNNQKTSFYNRSYGSTTESEKFVDRYGRRSRDSTEFSSELVEYALKLRPQKRQVIELKEFPPGYSKACLNIDLESDPCVVYDPCLEQVHKIRPGSSDRFTRSDSDLPKLSRTDRIDQSEKYDSTSLFDVGKPRKSSLKSLLGKSKSNSKVVHFFPSNLKYDKQFVQLPSQNEIIKRKDDNFQKKYGFSDPIAASITTYTVSDMQDCLPSRENFSKASMDKDLQEPPTKLRDMATITKEHAIDWDLPSPLMENTSNADPLKQSHGRGSSNVNLRFSHSTDTIPASNENFTLSKDVFSSIRNMGTKQSLTRFESFSSSYTETTDFRMSSSCRDLHDIEADYKPEPLAGLLSPKLNANHAGDVLTCRTLGYNKDKAFTDCIQRNSQSESVISRDQSSYRKYSNIRQDFSHNKCYPVKES